LRAIVGGQLGEVKVNWIALIPLQKSPFPFGSKPGKTTVQRNPDGLDSREHQAQRNSEKPVDAFIEGRSCRESSAETRGKLADGE
jgi:hypothetical protein